MDFYKCSVRSLQIDGESGRDKKVTDNYLIEAVSYTDAETIANDVAAEYHRVYEVTKVIKTGISNVVESLGNKIFLFKYEVELDDLETGKVRTVLSQEIIRADNIEQSLHNIKEYLSGWAQDSVKSLVETNYIEIIRLKKES